MLLLFKVQEIGCSVHGPDFEHGQKTPPGFTNARFIHQFQTVLISLICVLL